MLSPEYYDSCADAILAHYAQLEDDILRDIIRRLMLTGNMTDTAKHQAEMLQQVGLLYEDIIREIAARTDATAKQVQTVFEDAGVETVEIDNTVYRDMGKVPVDIRQSDAMRQVLEAGFRKTLGDVQNLTLTTAVTAQTAYKAACNSAYMQVFSGAFDYQTAIRNAIRQAAVQGSTVLYPSGTVSQLDVAIRRSVLTGIGQTCREIGIINAEESGCDLMEITAHSGARPEHARWQGQLVDRTGKRVGERIDGLRVYSLRDIKYGDVQGFGGANCRHDWYPYFEGYSTPNYTQKELEKLNERNVEYNGKMYTQYEISQMQRAGERKVRALKREAVAYDTAAKNAPDSATELEMKNAFQVTSVKLKDAEKQLKGFCKETGQDRDRFREQVNGFGRSQAQRAVQSNNAHFRKTMKEKGFENPPKSLEIFEKMRYTNPKEYDLMKSYEKSVDTGILSPLVGYEKYKEYHNRVENELVGLTTSNGITIKSQSKHFLERVFGTVSDPSHGGRPRNGVKLEKIADAVKNGSVRQHKNGSYVYTTPDCEVSLNPETGNLIQVTPKKRSIL